MDNEAIESAIRDSIAKTILEGIDTAARDALLQKTIKDVIGSYSFRSAVESVVAEKAASVVSELVDTDDWNNRIIQVIREGFEVYLRQLKSAIPKVIAATIHGTDGEMYSRQVASILKTWPKIEAE